MKYNSSRLTKNHPLPLLLKAPIKNTPNKQTKWNGQVDNTPAALWQQLKYTCHSNQPPEVLYTPEHDILPQTHLLPTEHPPFPLLLCPKWHQPLCIIWVLLMLRCRELARASAVTICFPLQKGIQVVMGNGISASRPFTCGSPPSVILLPCSVTTCSSQRS